MPVNEPLSDDELVTLRAGRNLLDTGPTDVRWRLLATIDQYDAEVERLRAALAARPQPDLGDLVSALVEYDRLHEAFMNDPAEDVETAVRLTAPLPAAKDAVSAAAREAVAGSATPTGDNE